MITKPQYLRLCMVLLVPLLLLGWWLSEKEILLPHHGVISCAAGVDDFVCTSIFTKRDQATQMMLTNGAVSVAGKARLEFGLRQAVVMHKIPGADDQTKGQAVTKNGNQEFLILPPASISPRADGQLFGYYGTCEFAPYTGKVNEWLYMCHTERGGEPGVFSFADEAVNRKFQALFEDVLTKSADNARLSLIAQIVSVLAPCGIFLLLSLAVWALIKTTRFVIGPRQNVA